MTSEQAGQEDIQEVVALLGDEEVVHEDEEVTTRTDDEIVFDLEVEEEELEEELPPVTAVQLVNELKERHFRAALKKQDEERLLTQLQQGVVNPIMLARYVNVQPQMIYAAIRDGKLLAAKENNTQKLFITTGDALRWAAKYLTGKQQRDARKAMKEAIDTVEA
jgi:hypothetical protein